MTTDAPTPRRTQTRERLMDAAVEAFARHGVGGASVEAICELAGFTRGAFYSNFDSKVELCEAVLERLGRQNLEVVSEALDRIETVDADSVEAVVRQVLGMYMASGGADPTSTVAAIELRLQASRDEALRPVYLNVNRRITDGMAAVLTAASARHHMELDVPAVQLCSMMHAMFEFETLKALMGDQSPEDAVENLAQVVRALLRPAPESDAAAS